MEPKEEPNDDQRFIPHNNQILDSTHILPKEPKEEPLDISTAFLPKEISHSSVSLQMEPKEEPIDDLYPEYPVDNQTPLLASDDKVFAPKKEEMMEATDTVDAHPILENFLNKRPIKDEIVDDSYGNDLSPNLAMTGDEIPLGRISYPRCNDSMEHSHDGEEEPTTKKTRLDSDKLNGMSVNLSDSEDDSTESVDRQLISKRSDTDMECIECEFRTKIVGSWTNHLRRAHSTTPVLAGLILRCACGHECASPYHSYTCPLSNFSVIRKNNDPIRRLKDVTIAQVKFILPTTPKCVLCESYPKTPGGYAAHLATRHKEKSTLNANKIYLICACGYEIHTAHHTTSHKKECGGHQFTLHELKDEVPSTPKCILCEIHPKTPTAYINHLYGKHKDIPTLRANGIYLLSECGFKIYSSNSHKRHCKKCNCLQFTVHKWAINDGM